jgi:hypothetical protein
MPRRTSIGRVSSGFARGKRRRILYQYSVEPWSVYQAFTELRKGGFTVLFIVLSVVQMEETSFMHADAGGTTTVDGEPLWGTRKGMRARLLGRKERNETIR